MAERTIAELWREGHRYAAGELSLGQARERLAASEFARDMRIAASREDAVQVLAELLIRDKAWVDGGGGAVLWISTWRD